MEDGAEPRLESMRRFIQLGSYVSYRVIKQELNESLGNIASRLHRLRSAGRGPGFILVQCWLEGCNQRWCLCDPGEEPQ